MAWFKKIFFLHIFRKFLGQISTHNGPKCHSPVWQEMAAAAAAAAAAASATPMAQQLKARATREVQSAENYSVAKMTLILS